MIKSVFRQYIADTDFKSLFNTLGWNRYQGLSEFNEEIDGFSYHFRIVGQIKGFQAIVCDNAEHITASLCKRIDYKLRPYAQSYICIFVLPTEQQYTLHHVWAIPIRKPEKKDIVLIEYTSLDQTELLYQKISGIRFVVNEQGTITISDVRERIYNTFEVNSERLTKDFYTGFRRQHSAFCEFITGINDQTDIKNNSDKQWYASVMLNRLMFCYFIQKKGFLDGDVNYLRNKLSWCSMQCGTGQFYSFYRSFLLKLFHGGLNSPMHNSDFEAEFGRIPYLNGGMFDVHQLERDYDSIDIKDEAFEQLFHFFDLWNWHLDTRMTASGRDINPDVLGYIFEQYINDRAQMGAYYTKEDITEYIGKNCIIPFLMDKLKEQDPNTFKPNGYVWQMLKNSGDKYIYDAVKKGVEHWAEIPDEIAQGIDTTQPDLLERRVRWNEKTPEQWALPTEIWRESIERMQRCRDIQSKISNGEITEINDFITYNLDIRTFVQDLLEKTDDHLLLLHFHKALTQISILDPTCGSGAFLFAAMNILEPLYETCINRMQEFNDQNSEWFKDILADLQNKYRSNIQYYIYKTIILNNLYGVDIMHEAVEIAKLRLFLKMVAVVDVDMCADNLGLDPLPDIDFNIRCGNTLVGYATEEQLNNDLNYGDMFANMEFKEKIETEMQKVSKTFDRFRKLQLTQSPEDMQAFKEAKTELNNRLTTLNNLLNHKMHSSITAGTMAYDKWLKSHQPFHWLAEYYNIIHGNGGFDVIIGNPPYVVYTDNAFSYAINDNYTTKGCANLYAFCVERCQTIINTRSRFGMIIPNSSISAAKMIPLQKILTLKGNTWISNYSWRPSKLFEGADMLLAIILKNVENDNKIFSSIYHKWYNQYRPQLFMVIRYNDVTNICIDGSIPKMPSYCAQQILKDLSTKSAHHLLGEAFRESKKYHLYYFRAVQYWFKVLDREPIYDENGVHKTTGEMKPIGFDTEKERNVVIALLSSSLFFLHYIIWSSCQVVNSRDFNIPFDIKSLSVDNYTRLSILGEKLQHDYQKNSHIKTRNYSKKGRTFTMQKQHFFIKFSKSIIDEIDKVLAKHYGFTEEELDFIINYDIKYRMGDELNEE